MINQYNIDDLCEAASMLIKQEYRSEFLRFVEFGEASEDFLRYLDVDEQAQYAVHTVFHEQIMILNQKARKIEQIKILDQKARKSSGLIKFI